VRRQAMPILEPEHRMQQLKVASGTWTTVAASDTVPTGLNFVYDAVASLESDFAIGLEGVTCVVPTQTGSAGGTITIKTWKPTSSADATPVAATAFSRIVHWIAFGY